MAEQVHKEKKANQLDTLSAALAFGVKQIANWMRVHLFAIHKHPGMNP